MVLILIHLTKVKSFQRWNWIAYMHVQSLSCIWLFVTPWDMPFTRLLWPWGSPGKNTGVDCSFLLQGIFQILGWKQWLLCLLQWQADSVPLRHLPWKQEYRLLKGKEIHKLLSKAVFQENFEARNLIWNYPSPFPPKSVHPTRFNPILENLDHAQL